MLQYISHFTQQISYAEGIRMALEGGCRWIQLRMKDAPAEEYEIGRGFGPVKHFFKEER